MTLALGRTTQERSQSQEELIIYVRNDGDDDANSGLTSDDAFATFERAANALRTGPVGKLRQVIEASGWVGAVDADSPLLIEGPSGFDGVQDWTRPAGFTNGDLDVWNAPFEIRAQPVTVRAITVTGETPDLTTGMAVLTVSDTLVDNAHVGQWVDGGLAVVGVIQANTANTITVAGASSSFAATSYIRKQSCEITVDGYGGIRLRANCSTILSGIRVIQSGSTSSAGFEVEAYPNVYFQLCRIDGLQQARERGGAVGRVDALWCHFENQVLLDGCIPRIQGCVVKSAAINIHSSLGDGEYLETIFDACNALGGGNFESRVNMEIDKCWFVDGTSHAISVLSPYRSRISNCKFTDNTGDAIRIECGGGYKRVYGCTGSGNGGYGLRLFHGSHVEDNGGNTVSGSSGDVMCGVLAATWATINALGSGESIDDLGEGVTRQLCRVFAA